MSEHQAYSADQIQVLEGLEGVRRRPAMYIGSTDARGLHRLIFEVVDNSIDEALAGFCTEINVTLNPDDSVTVKDNGRGIPVEVHAQTGKPALEVVMTMLHAGGKFDHKTYRVSGGLHGIGVSAVNALSEWLEVEVHLNGSSYKQRYERGVTVTPVQKVGQSDNYGTIVRFRADPEIFEETKYDYRIVIARLRELAFLTNGLSITSTDERVTPPKSRTFKYEGGLKEFIRYLNESKNALHDDIVYVSGKKGDVQVEFAFQYTDDYSWSIHTFANNIDTREGGTHLIGMKTALTRAINDYATGHGLIDEEKLKIQGDDVREGLTAVLSIRIPNPQFEGQTKTRLGNSELRGTVESILYDGLKTHFSETPAVARAIVQRTVDAAKARIAAKEAKELVRKKGSLESVTLPGKLADCQTHDLDKSELFIVEGPSAGGCFSGDTKLALADGRQLSFKEIIKEQDQGIEHFCYTIRHDGKIGIEKLTHPRLTRRNAQVVKVILDNGNEIICTPDHLFMLRDGSYGKAKDLQLSGSLMPLHTKLSDKSEPGITIQGYEMVWDIKSESWLFTHVLADWYNLWKGNYTKEAGDHCHHVDFDKRNNNPTNIIRLNSDQHLALHRKHLGKALLAPATIMKSSKEKGRLISKGHRLKALQLLNTVLKATDVREAYERLRLKEAPTALHYDRLLQEHYAADEKKLREAAANVNCKVVAVLPLDERMDVYDITVDHSHNFALAGGVFVHNSAKQARERRTQAILPLRGKIINVEKHGFSRILDNEEIRALITAIGTGIGDDFDVHNLRYGKIVLLTDADVDGAHIRTLLLTFLYRHMLQLIEAGHVFIAQPPLYRIRKGDRVFNVMSEKDRKRIIEQDLKGKADLVQRFKGLGEMNPRELWETTMNPATRSLLSVTIDDAAEADKVFSTLMGDLVEPRRRFIQENADEVDWLDI